ncbi:hypothetical protein GW17_00005725 [Ensete ventricosum]|nr:hypothetical protein GW17_00005725 [Ensete ventricosum]
MFPTRELCSSRSVYASYKHPRCNHSMSQVACTRTKTPAMGWQTHSPQRSIFPKWRSFYMSNYWNASRRMIATVCSFELVPLELHRELRLDESLF